MIRCVYQLSTVKTSMAKWEWCCLYLRLSLSLYLLLAEKTRFHCTQQLPELVPVYRPSTPECTTGKDKKPPPCVSERHTKNLLAFFNNFHVYTCSSSISSSIHLAPHSAFFCLKCLKLFPWCLSHCTGCLRPGRVLSTLPRDCTSDCLSSSFASITKGSLWSHVQQVLLFGGHLLNLRQMF